MGDERVEQAPSVTAALASIERLKAENQIWRELISEVREAATNIVPVIWHSAQTERARKCMANPMAMAAEVDQRIAEDRERALERESAVAAQEAAGGEADEG